MGKVRTERPIMPLSPEKPVAWEVFKFAFDTGHVRSGVNGREKSQIFNFDGKKQENRLSALGTLVGIRAVAAEAVGISGSVRENEVTRK